MHSDIVKIRIFSSKTRLKQWRLKTVWLPLIGRRLKRRYWPATATSRITDDSGKYHYEYKELLGEGNFISESSFNKMSGQNIDIQTEKVAVILTKEANEGSAEPSDVLLLTNMTTQKTLSVSFQEYLHDDMLAFSNFITYYVLDDTDYTAATQRLSDS
jgi:putative ABC transport system permease protein